MATTNPIKKLLSETAIYGLSSILARMINFLFFPIYIRILSQEDYGSYTEIMSYIMVLQVVLVFGLETGCFKFANNIKNAPSEYGGMSEKDPFSTSFITILATSLCFWLGIALFSNQLSQLLGYNGGNRMIIYFGGILALDSLTAVLFAQLRYLGKALKFAIFKTIKIISEVGFNIILFFVVPQYISKHPDSILTAFIPSEIDYSYILFAIFLSCVVSIVLFIPDLVKMKLSFRKSLIKPLLIYSIPIMVAGLPGILNESLDRIMFRYLAPDSAVWKAELGIYGAALKLAVIMQLFIQMFRYAAEPFFFSRGKNRELLAEVMEYFVAFCMIIFLGTMLYMDIIGLLLSNDYRCALNIVPFMLLSNMALGMLFNVSMWYKLSGQTKFAVKIALAGLFVTLIVNLIFMPLFSYWASVAAHLLSVMFMLIYSVQLGNRHYPIPYRWGIIIKYIAIGVGIYIISYIMDIFVWETPSIYIFSYKIVLKLLFNTLLLIGFIYYYAKSTGIYNAVIGMIKHRESK